MAESLIEATLRGPPRRGLTVADRAPLCGTAEGLPFTCGNRTGWRGSCRIFFVVSNRRTYMHVRNGGEVPCIVPPRLPGELRSSRFCALPKRFGLGISRHGIEDMPTVDSFRSTPASWAPEPPPIPTIACAAGLTSEEELANYDGFSNECLWAAVPHLRIPAYFSCVDWEAYQAVMINLPPRSIEEISATP